MPCSVGRLRSNYPQPHPNRRRRWRSVDRASVKQQRPAPYLRCQRPRWRWRAECCRCSAHLPPPEQETVRWARLSAPRVPVQLSRLQMRAFGQQVRALGQQVPVRQAPALQEWRVVVARAVPRGHLQRSPASPRLLSRVPALRAQVPVLRPWVADWMSLPRTANEHRSFHGDTSNDAWFRVRCDSTSDCPGASASLEQQGSYLRRARNCSMRG